MACAIEHPEFSSGRESQDRRVQRLTRALARLG